MISVVEVRVGPVNEWFVQVFEGLREKSGDFREIFVLEDAVVAEHLGQRDSRAEGGTGRVLAGQLGPGSFQDLLFGSLGDDHHTVRVTKDEVAGWMIGTPSIVTGTS